MNMMSYAHICVKQDKGVLLWGNLMFQDPSLRALILSTLAGLSTLLGAIVLFFAKKENKKLLSVSLGFAAGIMLSVSFTDLFPEAEKLFKTSLSDRGAILCSVAFLIFGLMIASLIDIFVPHEDYNKRTGEQPHKNLFRVGFVSMAAIGLHNFPEGVATFMAGYKDVSLGISIALAISLHNIPEGIAVAMPIYYATNSKRKALKYTFLSGIAEPVGALMTYLVLRPFINDFILAAVFSTIAGLMIYIAIEEMIPSSRQYGHDREALVATFAGICLMPLTHVV